MLDTLFSEIDRRRDNFMRKHGVPPNTILAGDRSYRLLLDRADETLTLRHRSATYKLTHSADLDEFELKLAIC